MKPIISLIILCSLLFFEGLAQNISSKPPLALDTYKNWQRLHQYAITNDGNFTVYRHGPVKEGYDVMVIQSNKNKDYRIEIPRVIDFDGFTDDSKKIIYKLPGDSLAIYDLYVKTTVYFVNVKDFKSFSIGKSQFLLYSLQRKDLKGVVLKRIDTDWSMSFSNAESYFLGKKNNLLLLNMGNCLMEFNMLTFKSKVIFEGNSANYAFDRDGNQLVFLTENQVNEEIRYSLMYYKKGMTKAEVKLNNNDLKTNDLWGIANRQPYFSQIGDRIFFHADLKNEKKEANNDKLEDVKIWNSQDRIVQDNLNDKKEYLEELKKPVLMVININTNKVIQLVRRNETVWNASTDKYLLVQHEAERTDAFWKPEWTKSSLFLVSTTDGSRYLVKENYERTSTLQLSPSGKYVFYFDRSKKQYISYNTKTHSSRIISGDVPVSLKYVAPLGLGSIEVGFGGCLEDENSIFVYDRFDIWQLDSEGTKPPINVTGGYGRRNHTALRLVKNDDHSIFRKNEGILLQAFNTENKNNGFYRLTLNSNKLDSLTMGPYVYCLSNTSLIESFSQDNQGALPKKARDTQVYLVYRMSAKESPNLFLSSDLKTFSPLTNIRPEQQFNWLNSELVRWKMFDGNQGEGILYKPENFDPRRKYPVIFYYYEHLSDVLNTFPEPRLTNGTLPISEFVSNGYIVFIPSIYYKVGEPGPSAYNCVVSGAKYLSGFPWIDSVKMGLQGFSFGGFQTGYITTQTNLFAAAAPAAGVYDIISRMSNPEGGYHHPEAGQGRIGASLWNNKAAYINNSTVFQADKINTPLLIEIGGKDTRVEPGQGRELFKALRRNNKKVWMLEYPSEGHGLGGKPAEDYGFRLKQFFDHYLKDQPIPKWMAEPGNKSLELNTPTESNRTK
nr:prolyl oligopeptidase family serine peptidase [uncultured Pedobacter sp.]